MRYIIGSTLTLLGPTIGRIGPVHFDMSIIAAQTLQDAVIFVILFGLVLYDQRHQRNYHPYMIAVYAFVVHAAIFYWLFI